MVRQLTLDQPIRGSNPLSPAKPPYSNSSTGLPWTWASLDRTPMPRHTNVLGDRRVVTGRPGGRRLWALADLDGSLGHGPPLGQRRRITGYAFSDYRAVELERELSTLPPPTDEASRRFHSELSAQAAAAISKYGRPFKRPLSWALPALGDRPGLHSHLMSMAPRQPHNTHMLLAQAPIHVSARSDYHYANDGTGTRLGSTGGVFHPGLISLMTLAAVVTDASWLGHSTEGPHGLQCAT